MSFQLLDYSESEEGREVIKMALADVLAADLPFTPQIYLDRPERVERILGVYCEASAAGVPLAPFRCALLDGRFDEVAMGEPLLLEEEDMQALADVVRPDILPVLLALRTGRD